MSEHELSLQINLYVNVLLSMLRLPPSIESIALLSANDVLDDVAVVLVLILFARVTNETFRGIFSSA